MSAKTKVSALDHAMQTAHTWVHDVAREFDTEDREFAYRVLRAWLHTLRDRLTVEASAHFAAQLPDLIRGIFYAGWNPSAVPEKWMRRPTLCGWPVRRSSPMMTSARRLRRDRTADGAGHDGTVRSVARTADADNNGSDHTSA